MQIADGASLYWELHGAGERAIVLCDGLGCDGFAWKYLLPVLKRRARVLHWHYRGHGRSSMPTDGRRIGMSYTCDDLETLYQRAGFDRAVVLGHSMGVQVALEFHRRHTRRVTGLGLLCGSYGFPLDTLHDTDTMKKLFPYIERLVETFPRAVGALLHRLLPTELALQYTLSFELNRQLLSKEDLVPYFEHLANMNPLAFTRTLRSLSEHTAWDHLPHIAVPTLVVGGGRDKFTPIWLSTRMAHAIPGARLVTLPGGSHTAPLEYAPAVEREVLRFLELCV